MAQFSFLSRVLLILGLGFLILGVSLSFLLPFSLPFPPYLISGFMALAYAGYLIVFPRFSVKS